MEDLQIRFSQKFSRLLSEIDFNEVLQGHLTAKNDILFDFKGYFLRYENPRHCTKLYLYSLIF